MSMKKKLGSRLADGVQQVKAQREQKPGAAPAKTAPVAKQRAKPTPASVATQPLTSPTAQAPKPRLDKLHPRRIWPD